MIENSDFRIEEPDLSSKFDVELIRRFLSPLGFYFDESTVEYSVILYTLNDDIVGVGSCQGKILKYVAVAPQFRESGAFAHIVTHLTERVMSQYQQAFVFTRPDNISRFEGIGYRHIASAQPLISVLEFGYQSIDDYKQYLQSIKYDKQAEKVAAIVINGNPYTLGHQYLIEKASTENDWLYVFVVQAEKSTFSFSDRFEMIRLGTQHLSNIQLVKGGEYIVSCATFPNYFLKNEAPDAITQKQAELDIEIFSQHIAPLLGINKRYVGTENYCATTALYNKAMKTILPTKGVAFCEVQRLETGKKDGGFISASKVREAIKAHQRSKLGELLPETTILYLKDKLDLDTVEQRLRHTAVRH
ncbi:[citrate (pro-3S)-lyase] ligase [Carboxylicivirga sp. A043]|uniref:[citrate (pro-3S)-lyase] ligase n=1 Tax=Carboxylicivirga litoralis TaxID=2816963 RepID=UPI0021CB340A|nr:[citrate (pro-3S)-lyase] ligase [Carboxylicivirga sp. A043]MCU4157372.1 [citrate (pro-3S)-lyase] ligase [Carboxylicivirga sp. A043]